MAEMNHGQLLMEAQADGAVLEELSKRLHGLHGKAIRHGPPSEFDALRLELTALRDEFGSLHERDLAGDIDQQAHSTWRARVRRLSARLDEFTADRES